MLKFDLTSHLWRVFARSDWISVAFLTKADCCKWSNICNQGNMKGKTEMMSFLQMMSRTLEFSQRFSLIYFCQVTAFWFLDFVTLMAPYVFCFFWIQLLMLNFFNVSLLYQWKDALHAYKMLHLARNNSNSFPNLSGKFLILRESFFGYFLLIWMHASSSLSFMHSPCHLNFDTDFYE